MLKQELVIFFKSCICMKGTVKYLTQKYV